MNNKIEKKDIQEMKLLSNEELKKLNFHELCLYLELLDNLENELKAGE